MLLEFQKYTYTPSLPALESRGRDFQKIHLLPYEKNFHTPHISYLGVRVGNIDGSKRFNHSADQQVHWGVSLLKTLTQKWTVLDKNYSSI